MTTENIKDFLEQKTNIESKNWKRVSKKTLPNKDEIRVFEDKSSGLVLETIEHSNGHIQIVCIKGNFHDKSLDKAILIFEEFEDELYDIEYVVVKDENKFYLVPEDEGSGPIFGPFNNQNDAEQYYTTGLELNYYPQNLCFDVEEDDTKIIIHLGGLVDEGADNLGSHNVNGLPYNLPYEDMENTWSVKDKTIAQVKQDMIACGFEYCAFRAK